MSGPFVYRPTTPTTYASRYRQSPYFPTPHTPRSPFIPDASLYPPSPYSNSGSPNRGFKPLPEDPTTPSQFEFPTLSPYEADYGGLGLWDSNYPRERRPSWQGYYENTPWSQAARLYSTGDAIHRRHSFGASGYQPPYFDPGVRSPNTLFRPLFINPWIDAEAPRRDFYFDLSLPQAQPTQLYENGMSELIREEEAMIPATHPPITRMRIVHPAIEEWPLDIQLSTEFGSPTPITVMDVLFAIHQHLHRRVSPAEYAQLTGRGRTDVARSFTKRCRAIPNNFHDERQDGLKRVDYLLGKTKMRGLVRDGHIDGWEVMKLVVTE